MFGQLPKKIKFKIKKIELNVDNSNYLGIIIDKSLSTCESFNYKTITKISTNA